MHKVWGFHKFPVRASTNAPRQAPGNRREHSSVLCPGMATEERSISVDPTFSDAA